MSFCRPPTELKSVSRANPCAVCQGIEGCSVGADGLILCRRRQAEQAGFVCLGPTNADPQWTLYRRDGDPVLQDGRPPQSSTVPNGQQRPAVDVQGMARTFAANLTIERACDLAKALGLPAAALSELPLLGYCPEGPHPDPGGSCFTFPEVDAQGNVIGLNCRYGDGSKRAWPGGRRGLTVPSRWQERDGPILLPEGATDVASLTALGLAAIGRPSNMGGVEMLAEVLREISAERSIIVLGEMDANADGQWPGRGGAEKTASALTAKLGRPIRWALPPVSAKDVRAWCQERRLPTAGQSIADDWSDAGTEFLAALKPIEAKTLTSAVFGFKWEPIDSAAFAAADYRPAWLCKGILVAKQPAMIGGPQKALKTTVALDLAISLASGTPFLGKFPCPKPCRVAILSGESGPFTLQETAKRICAAKGLNLADLGENLCWQFTLPQLASMEQLQALRDGLVAAGVEAVIIDPLYLSLLAGGDGTVRAENLYEVGPLLLRVAQACLAAGATPILLHHTRKGAGKVGEPLDLTDLAFSGVAEFARQWLLLSRREPYEPGTGQHQLWLVGGGSVGHGGLYALEVDEGQLAEDFTGRQWEVTVNTATDARQTEAADKEEAKRQREATQLQADKERILHVLTIADPDGRGLSYTQLRDRSGVSGRRFGPAIVALEEAEDIEQSPGNVSSGHGAPKAAKIIRRKRAPHTPDTLLQNMTAEQPAPRPDPQAERANQAARGKAERQEADALAILRAMEVNDPDNHGMTSARARDGAGLTSPRFGAALTALKAADRVEDVPPAEREKKRPALIRRRLADNVRNVGNVGPDGRSTDVT